jgi:hypothetical protein
MITLLLDLLAIDAVFGFAANRQQLKRLKAAKADAEAFQSWAERNPHHPLTQRVEAELLEIQQNLRMNRTEKVWAGVVVAENAYVLMREVQERLDTRTGADRFFDRDTNPNTIDAKLRKWLGW